MTIHALFVIVLIMFVISLIGDIVLAHRLNKHTEDYDDLLTRVDNINKWCNEIQENATTYKNLVEKVIHEFCTYKQANEDNLIKRHNEISEKITELELDILSSEKAIKNVNSKVVTVEDQVKLLNTDADALEESINYVQNQVSKLTKPGEATKEVVKQVLDEMDVLSGSIINGQLEIKEH